MNDSKGAYAAETIGSIMSTTITTCYASNTVGEVLKQLSKHTVDSFDYVYVINPQRHLTGYTTLTKLLSSPKNTKIHDIADHVEFILDPEDDQEKAVFIAVREDIDAIPVVDDKKRIIGSVGAKTLIEIMHQEHIEDALLAAGIRHKQGTSILKLATSRIYLVFATRAPWLIFGAIVGIGLGFVASRFEASLEETVTLAYFIPVVAYIADSVGAQSSTISIRAMATLKISFIRFLFREMGTGLLLGITLGTIGAIGAFLISDFHLQVSIVVGISLAFACLFSTFLASIVPVVFSRAGKDPALGSGPIATALQDLASILIYFVVAGLVI